MYRSTKGASKARRDQINAEIRNLKDLLPITDTDKARLSYLHIMSLACMYTRKSLFFSQDTSCDQSSGFMSFHELSELIHELAGFMVVVTGEGKLLYLSENVIDHLGLCMVDLIAQSDSVYDIVDPSDHFVMRSNLAPAVTGDKDRLFRCDFNTSKFIRRQSTGNKTMLVRARCLAPPSPGSSYCTSTPVWVCFCTPLRLKPSAHTTPGGPPLTPPPEHSFFLASFHSQHLRDMTVWDAQDSVTVYLGYDVEALRSRSWYSLLHPRDLSHASTQHCALLSEGVDKQVEMVVQVETAEHSWVWLYMVLQMGGGEHPITCNNYVISESEAWSLRQQLSLEQQSHSSGYYSSGDCMPRHSALSSPDQVFTPSSSGLSAQSFDFTTAQSGSSFSDEVMQPADQHPPSRMSSREEESLILGRQQWNSSVSPSTSSSLCSPQTPMSGDYSIGVDHFSSVQSTPFNCMAVGGATMAARAATRKTMNETAEDELMDTSEFPVSASLAASQEPASVLDHPARPHTVPHAQFLMEELVAMDQVFEADVSISPFWGNNLSCINSHSTTLASRSFRQGGSLRDPAF
ncbi:neuronal PAS domain-containing protein 4B-like [Hypomesus transpacificus]|uniref:neuronal PAS domain-containing protein 4B-like n=1 Tax=Hypomesus transpacificus TaxID=137520 RepID=UPI001F08848D|nr:neuronal PAS domain-containing protein 4B-like [Hypomesus transpacificus]